jgi:hypothetical protein
MKYLLYLILLIIIFPEISSTELAPYSKFANDNKFKEWEKISSNRIAEKYSYRIDVNDAVSTKQMISKEYFDEKGRTDKFESIDYYGVVQVLATYKYNEEDMLMEIEEKDSFRTIVQKQTFSYDPFSKLARVNATGFNDVFIQRLQFEYLPEKSVAIESVTDSTQKVLAYTVHLYDTTFNRIIKSTNYTKENEIDGLTAFFYDNNGINSREIYAKDIDEPYKIKYQNAHDEKGNLIEVQNITFPNVLLVTVKHEYNEMDMIISTTMYDSKGEVITRLEYDYVLR